MMEMWTIYTLAIFIYLAIVAFIGLYAWRVFPPLELEDYTLAGRSLGWVTGLFTFGATQWSALSFMGFMVLFYLDGVSGLLAIWGMYIVLTGTLWMIYAPRVHEMGRRLGHGTPSQMLNDWYDSKYLGMLVGAFLILAVIPYLQIQLTGMSYVIGLASGGRMGFWVGTIIVYVIALIYVWAGGLKSVAWTDAFQGALFIFLGVIVGLILFWKAGGLEVFSDLAADKPGLFSMPGLRGAWTSLFLWSWAIPVGFGWVFHPHMWIRQHALEKKKYVFLFPVFMILCWWSIILFQGFLGGMSGNTLLPGFGEPDKILIEQIVRFIPALFIVVAPAAIAAMMSSVDSQAHGIGTVISTDFSRELSTEVTQRRLIYVARIGMTVALFFGLIMQAIYPKLLVELGALTASLGVQVMPITIPPLFARGKWITKEAAAFSVTAGVVVTLLTHFVWKFPLGVFSGAWGLVAGFVSLPLVSLVTKTGPKEETVSKFREVADKAY